MSRHSGQATKILFVDDDPGLRTVVPIALAKDGHEVDTAGNGMEALSKFDAGKYDLVIQDVRMPGIDGLELLARLKEADPETPVVIMTAFSTWDVAVAAMRLGGFDYLKKPFDNDDLRNMARRAIEFRTAAEDKEGDGGAVRFIGSSPAVKEILDLVRRVAPTDSTVVIEGESGTGKELVAGLLHAQSPRRSGPFIAVNCGGFSETLLESELFGHIRGSFTGAVADKRGLMELANGGTFFLDEVGETSLSTQVRLLRALETRTFVPVGGEKPLKTDARFVTATNRDLREMMEAGSFRHDLYYRLNVIPIRIPPLRERRDDIPLLAGHFLATYSQRFHKDLKGFDSRAMEALMRHSWPGNVRELQNVVQRAVSLAEVDSVGVEHIAPFWKMEAESLASAPEAGSGAVRAIPELPDAGFDLEKTLQDIESELVREALEKTGFNLTKAAELLGISFRSIRYKVKKLGLEY
ncbi:MAG: sigma-54 dependent transcriptional regulator [Planctomycetota bacterium]|jgi:DNA-binding NtrC family response regulator|nr:sigma-54 dependent transcriptional regulator [Planctomycetota bacterium]